MSCCCSTTTDLGCIDYCDDVSLGTTVATTGTYTIKICQPTVHSFTMALTSGNDFDITNNFNEDAVSIFSIENPDGSEYTLNGADCWQIENRPL